MENPTTFKPSHFDKNEDIITGKKQDKDLRSNKKKKPEWCPCKLNHSCR